MTDWSDQTTLSEAAGPVIEAYVDGSCLDNGSPDAIAGVGCFIQSDEGRDSETLQSRIPLDRRATSTLAEYAAVIAALERIRVEHSTDVVVRIYSDSETVVRQLQGDYRVRKEHLEEPHRETQEFLNEFRDWRIEHRSESDAPEIERADELAKDATRGDDQ